MRAIGANAFVELNSAADDFASAHGDLLSGRPSNVPMLGNNIRAVRDDDFRSAGGSGGN